MRKPKFKAIAFNKHNQIIEVYIRTDSFDSVQKILKRQGLRPYTIDRVSNQ